MPSLTLTLNSQISSLLRRPSPSHSSSPSPAFPPDSFLSLSLASSPSRPLFRSPFFRQACVGLGTMSDLALDADKSSFSSSSSAAAAAAGDSEAHSEVEHSRAFIEATSHEELLSGIRNLAEAGKLPPNVAAGMEELFHTYKNAVYQSGIPGADEVILSNMSLALDRVLYDVEDPFEFSPYHKALRKPFDYYVFGQNYIRPLIDFRNSYVGNIDIFTEIQEKLCQGHNVVFMTNHQTEADPAIIALLLEKTHQEIAQNLIYVAGDRVLIDPLCKPFSMGRNLFCVYSKKHMFDIPELVDMKRKANIRSLKEMALLLRGGSQIVWIAPSGGRDRPDPVTEVWYPAPFDPSSVDNMRRLVEHSGVPGHVYPLSLLCYDIMPPPGQVEKEIGERRVVSFSGAGLSVSPAINSSEVIANCENPEEAKEAYTRLVYDSVVQQYNVLKDAIKGQKGLNASTERVALSQPWD
ncbi:hypothetical protein MLD38_036435 [Melastoma candidum]|uniref:Uncharacterized protein n=1 Tax=Melastoma candidum TaxID=119954 RepID=A0ACB9LK88_9MYRT|nr:hypothetical protein MLD38_036435 [Melastoma candidum]